MGNNSFILYDTDLKSMDYLTDAQIGKLFRAIKAYRLEGKTYNLGKNPALNMLYNQITEHLVFNEEKYNAIRQKRSDTMKKRWQDKKSTIVDYSALQSDIVEYSPLSDNDNDTDTVNGNGNVTDTVTVKDNVTGFVALGVKRENKRKNYNSNKNVPKLLKDDPAYDMEAFTRRAVDLKYHKKDPTPEEKDNPDGLS